MLLDLILPALADLTDRARTAVDNARVSVARRLDPDHAECHWRAVADQMHSDAKRRVVGEETRARYALNAITELAQERDEARARVAELEGALEKLRLQLTVSQQNTDDLGPRRGLVCAPPPRSKPPPEQRQAYRDGIRARWAAGCVNAHISPTGPRPGAATQR